MGLLTRNQSRKSTRRPKSIYGGCGRLGKNGYPSVTDEEFRAGAAVEKLAKEHRFKGYLQREVYRMLAVKQEGGAVLFRARKGPSVEKNVRK